MDVYDAQTNVLLNTMEETGLCKIWCLHLDAYNLIGQIKNVNADKKLQGDKGPVSYK